MDPKKAVTGLLVAFVVASVGFLIVKETRKPDVPVPIPIDVAISSTRPAPIGRAESRPAPEKVACYYFHGNQRCPTCRKIESLAHQTVESSFAEELADGRVEWRVANVQQPANVHFQKKFDIYSASLILVKTQGERQVEWKNLDKVWKLVGDEPAYTKYVREELRNFMEER